MERVKNWIHDRIDVAVMFAIALWLLFITLPSLDGSQITDDGWFHPARGQPGSCFMTQDGQHYVRTGRGIRKVGQVTGKALIARTLKIRRVALAKRVLLVAGTTAITAVILVSLS